MKWVTTNRCQIVDLTTLVRRWLLNVKEVVAWRGEESGASIRAAHITWPPFLLLAEWSVLAGNKNTYLRLFPKYFSLPVRLKHIFKPVSAEAVGRRFLLFWLTRGCEGCLSYFLCCSPARNVGMGLCSAGRPFLYLIKICPASWQASCLHVDDKSGETAHLWIRIRLYRAS